MNKYKYIKKKGVSFLTVEVKKGQQITERELYAIGGGEVSGLIPMTVAERFGASQLWYPIDGLAPLTDYLAEPVDKVLFSRLLSSILEGIRSVKQAVFNEASLLLDPDYLFVDPETGCARLIYIPIATYDCETDIRALLQCLVTYGSFDENEDTGYVQRFIEILNEGASFSLYSMEEYARELEAQVRKAQQPKLCPTCGKQVPPPFGFCPDCGVALVEMEGEPEVSSAGGCASLFRESTGERIPINGTLKIGKSRTNDYCLMDVSTVSRCHAVIDSGDRGWTVTDLGSTNGTFVNGREITPQAPVALAAGDRIRFAREDFIFEIRE